ncbi:MAG: pyrroline-5-carboxylate reductase [Lachnospiraceae bacterium]|nr:pyrroline-5-carboxylate reductase [Lachnospiraceae bacterium]
MKYGFIGAGNMAGAIIKGMVKKAGSGSNITVFNTSKAKTDALMAECGVNVAPSQKAVIDTVDVLILSVKPQVLDKIIETIKSDIGDRKPLIISIAVGKTIEYLETGLGADKAIVRVMPNINAKVLMSTSGYCPNNIVTKAQETIVEGLFEAVGSVTKIPEGMFSIFGVIAGSSPAFAYLYIDVVARAAQRAGMPKKQALEIAANTVLGSAKMVLESNEHPWELVDQVCSPGGTTIEGIYTLEENGFESTIVKAFDAVLAKDRSIQAKK